MMMLSKMSGNNAVSIIILNVNMCNANLYMLHHMLAIHFLLLSFNVEVNATIAIPEQRSLQ